jgi:hypothetical protein
VTDQGATAPRRASSARARGAPCPAG